MNGEQLFFRYAYPCASIRRDAGNITEEQYAKLLEVKDGKRDVDRKLLRWCFPHAFESIREHSRKIAKEAWSFENVASYWRENHGHSGLCRVLKVSVSSIDSEGRIYVDVPDEGQHIALNPFEYDVAPGDIYYMHQQCLTEKVKAE